MSDTTNKIKYGLTNCYYAPAEIAADGSATYGTPVRIPGAVALSMAPNGDKEPFYADNMEYWVSPGNNGYDGDLEIALVPEGFRKDILGEVEDGSGVLIEDANAETKHFALLFQFEGDVKATRHVLYNCTAARPEVNGATKEDAISPETESLDLTSRPVYNATLDKDIVKASRTNGGAADTVYSGWFEAVYTPVAVTPPTP